MCILATLRYNLRACEYRFFVQPTRSYEGGVVRTCIYTLSKTHPGLERRRCGRGAWPLIGLLLRLEFYARPLTPVAYRARGRAWAPRISSQGSRWDGQCVAS